LPAILFPVFGLMFLGVILRRVGVLDQSMEVSFNRFAYMVALPTFIVFRVAESPGLDPRSMNTALGLLLVTLGLLILGYLLAPLFRVPKRSRGTFVHSVFRGNLAYVGIPIVAVAVADADASLRQQAETLTILTLAPTVLVYNLLGVMVLEWDRRHHQMNHPFKAWLRGMIRNPLVIACVMGLIWNISGAPVSPVLQRLADPLGSTAFPLALLAIGARLCTLSWKSSGWQVIGTILLKNGIGLALGWSFAMLLGLEGIQKLVLMVLSTCPTAVASYVLVDQLDGDRDLGASSIAATTLASMLSLIAALALAL